MNDKSVLWVREKVENGIENIIGAHPYISLCELARINGSKRMKQFYMQGVDFYYLCS